jgi:NADH-quinone oxidoreductase subunit E
MSVRRLHELQPESFAFSADNLAWARKTIDKYPAGKQASAVIPLLWRAQEQNDGWVSKPAIEYVADMLGMSYIRVLEVATFYTMFQLAPVGKKAHVQVCGTTPCMLRGAEDLKKVCQRKIHAEPHHLNADGSLSWEEVECLGACVNAPMVQVWKDTYEDLTPDKLEAIIDAFARGETPPPGPQNGRQLSAPEGGPTALTDPSLYSGNRTFTRVEPAPPPPPVVAEAKPAEAPKVEVKPIAAVKPVEVTNPQAPAPNTAADLVKPRREAEAPKIDVKPMAEVKPVTVTNPQAPAPNTTADLVKPRRVERPDGQPELIRKPRAGSKADDLKLIWGVGPALERLLNSLGVWHFDQIADWTARELKWIDERLEGFKGRASRDGWVEQAKKLATGWRPEGSAGDRPDKK